MAVVRNVLGVLLSALILCTGCSGKDADSSWPQWRGPGGLGISDAPALPMSWGRDGTGIKWTASIDGVGTSSPIASGGLVFVTSARPSGKRVELLVHGIDLATGESLWQTPVARRKPERKHRMNTSAGPTPVSDGETVFAYFGSHLAALDGAGEVAWVHEIDPNYLDEARYAAGSSLVLSGDLVIVLRERERVADELIGWIAAFDKATGERVWRTEWTDSCCSYVTPLVLDHGTPSGKRELFVVLAGYVVSYDPETGQELWRKNQKIAQPVSSPVVEDDLVCVASGAHANRQARCWEIVEDGEAVKWRSLWKKSRWVPDTSSPVLLEGKLYLLTEKGILRALDARTGEMDWQKRLEMAGYRASLLAGGGHLYAVGDSGAVSIVSPADGEVVAVNYLPDSLYVASPAVAEGCLLIRSATDLYCVDGTS